MFIIVVVVVVGQEMCLRTRRRKGTLEMAFIYDLGRDEMMANVLLLMDGSPPEKR